MSNEKIAVVIPAGGGGTRLWPYSRQANPKHLLPITGPRTMLQETVARVEALAPGDSIFVVTNRDHAAKAHEQLPGIPPQNIVAEPCRRDSAPAIGMMAFILDRVMGPDTVMVVLPSDHAIDDVATFQDVIRLAARISPEGYLVTVGIPPTGPHTGFGYIHHAELIASGDNGLIVERVLQFHEKPDRATAERYLTEGSYYWNAGMYVATAGHLKCLFGEHMPDYQEPLTTIANAYGTPEWQDTLDREFPDIKPVSFDYAIAEKASKVAVVPAGIGWNDVGSWARLAEVLGAHGGATVAIGSHIGVDTTNTLVHGGHRLIATLGVDNLAIVDTPDVLLICPLDRSEEVKRIIDILTQRGDTDLL